MALNLGQIQASITLQTGNFVRSIQVVQGLMSRAFGSQTQQNVNGTANAMNNLHTHLKSVERVVGGILLSQTFYRATNSIQNATGSLVGFMNHLEQSKIAMQYFLGSAKEANAFIMTMEDFAATTPYSTEQAISLSQKLMAAQFDPTKVKSVMTILNDAASVGGTTAEQLDRIVLAITQMRTNGKIAGQELRQLAEANIPIYKILQQELGLTSDQLMNIGKLHIPGDVGVQALLKGLEKRYKGAADRIALTIPGLMATIKDDMLMVGQSLFEYPYKALSVFLRQLRDGLEWAREIVFKFGAGGLFERLFTPETQLNLRLILGSMRSLTQSASMVVTAMKPVIEIIGTWLARVFAWVLTPLAAVVRGLAWLIIIATKVIAPVRYLFAAILSLTVGYTVAKVLMILWRVTGLGLICTTVAKAVNVLTVAIRFLALTLIRNPIALALVAMGGAALYFGSKLDFVQRGIKSVKKGLGSLAGFDASKILTPKVNAAADAMGKFDTSVIDTNTDLTTTGQGLEGIGDKAKKAAKKIKESFLQSFDEVYTIKESADDASDALDDIGSNFEMPTSDLGGLMEVPDMGGITMPELGTLDTENLFPTAGDMWKKFKERLSDMWKNVKNWFSNIDAYDILTWAYHIGKFVNDAGTAIWDWTVDTASAVGGWFSDVGQGFADWYDETQGKITAWCVDAGIAIADWIVNNRFSQWVIDCVNDFQKWVDDTQGRITVWAVDTGISIANWVTDTAGSVAGWVTDTVTDFGNWATDTGTAIADWATDTLGDIGNWATNAGTNIYNWVSTNGTNLRNWATDAGTAIGNWASNAQTNVANWYNNTTNNIVNWVNNRYNDLANWATNAGNAIYNGFAWVRNGIATVFDNIWESGIKPGVNWAINRINTFVSWCNGLEITIPSVDIPHVGKFGGYSLSLPNIGYIPQLETGGIIKKDTIFRGGEKNRREAVVPLENPSYMKPFADAVAAGLMSSGILGNNQQQQQPVLYVGTLIADDRSLKELNRRMKVINLGEGSRGALT